MATQCEIVTATFTDSEGSEITLEIPAYTVSTVELADKVNELLEKYLEANELAGYEPSLGDFTLWIARYASYEPREQ